jgi:hypothetical protein
MSGNIIVYSGDFGSQSTTFNTGYSANGTTTVQGWFFNINLFYVSASVATASVNKFAC